MSYTPPDSSNPYFKAKEQIENQFLGKHGVHTVAIGKKKVAGKETSETAVVVYVADKADVNKLRAYGVPLIPQKIVADNTVIPVDVQEMPPPRDLRLHLPEGVFDPTFLISQAQRDQQNCFNCPLKGGVQIAPRNANWVGTLGGAVRYKTDSGEVRYGAITNAHVSGMNAEGQLMCQPHGRADWFAKVHRVVDLHFDGTANYIDCAILDVWREGDAYGSGCHTVKPEQLTLGAINPSVKSPALGDVVTKEGRTTGVTRGRCVGIEATSHVGYDEGTAVFKRQLVVEGLGMNFSAGGDSGSLVMLDSTKQPWGHLFAGGGNQTICNPIAFSLDWGKAEFYRA